MSIWLTNNPRTMGSGHGKLWSTIIGIGGYWSFAIRCANKLGKRRHGMGWEASIYRDATEIVASRWLVIFNALYPISSRNMVVVGDDSVNDYRNRNIVVAINSYDWEIFYKYPGESPGLEGEHGSLEGTVQSRYPTYLSRGSSPSNWCRREHIGANSQRSTGVLCLYSHTLQDTKRGKLRLCSRMRRER